MKNRRERENYSWELIQDMIDKEVSAAFKLRTPLKKEYEKLPKRPPKQTNHQRLPLQENGCGVPYKTLPRPSDKRIDVVDL